MEKCEIPELVVDRLNDGRRAIKSNHPLLPLPWLKKAMSDQKTCCRVPQREILCTQMTATGACGRQRVVATISPRVDNVLGSRPYAKTVKVLQIETALLATAAAPIIMGPVERDAFFEPGRCSTREGGRCLAAIACKWRRMVAV